MPPEPRAYGRTGVQLRHHVGGSGMTIPTVAEAARLIAAKKLSPVELTQDCPQRIQNARC
jgi:hypothetical protein